MSNPGIRVKKQKRTKIKRRGDPPYIFIFFETNSAIKTIIKSFNKKGRDALIIDTHKLFPVTKLYCSTPAKWQSKTPEQRSKYLIVFFLVFLAIPQTAAANINPHKNPPDGPNKTPIPPVKVEKTGNPTAPSAT